MNMNLSDLNNNTVKQMGLHYYPHFTDGGTETQSFHGKLKVAQTVPND